MTRATGGEMAPMLMVAAYMAADDDTDISVGVSKPSPGNAAFDPDGRWVMVEIGDADDDGSAFVLTPDQARGAAAGMLEAFRRLPDNGEARSMALQLAPRLVARADEAEMIAAGERGHDA